MWRKADEILKRAENLFRSASKEGKGSPSYNLAVIFENKGKLNVVIKYYLKAYRQGCSKAEKALQSLHANF